MVLGFDDAVGRGAFAGDVAVWVLRKGKGLVSLVEGLVLCWGLDGWGERARREESWVWTYRSTSSPRSFSMIAVGFEGLGGDELL